ncbi:MAG: methylenetetrahydrofolate reductase C-terminal domain-containing protein [bacterium]
MVIAEIKPLEEIKELVKGYKKILNTGCGGCTSVCLAGGQKEVDTLNTKLTLSFQADHVPFEIDGFTVERQCEVQFITEFDRLVKSRKYDAILSMACGAGVQFLAERYPETPVFPAVNSTFVGVNKDIGWYEERCKCCGDCVLGFTGGICPVSMCAKGLFNGPCGGPQGESCEVSKDIPCAWVAIYKRLKGQNRLESIRTIHAPRQWRDQIQGRIILEPYKARYVKSE